MAAPVGARWLHKLAWGILVSGILLRCWQYAGAASLHIDEIGLARNIADRSLLALFGPLSHGQTAPPGFLIAERLAWLVSPTDWSLRLVPFLGGIAAMFLYGALARRLLDDVAAMLALATLAVGAPFIMYGSWVKPYSTEVAIAIGLTVLAHDLLPGVPRRAGPLAAGLAGVLAVWFSNAAVFVVAGLAAPLLALAATGRLPDRQRVLQFVVIPWVGSAAAAALFARAHMSASVSAAFQTAPGFGFPILPPRSLADLAWPWQSLTNVVGEEVLGLWPASAYLLVGVVGAVVLWRRRRYASWLLFGPLLVTFAAALVHQYPFRDRAVLFLVPTLIALMASGASALVRRLAAVTRGLGWLALAAFLAGPLARLARDHPVYRFQETRPLFAWVRERARPGDAMLIWYRAVPAWHWYGVRAGIPAGEVVMGGCWLDQPRQLLEDVDRLRGRPRVWMVFVGSGTQEERLMSRYADSIGTRRDGLRLVPRSRVRSSLPVEARLYDLSDSTRLRNASAAGFPVALRRLSPHARLSCTVGLLSERPD
jgi:hypothetical protein